MPGSRFLRRCSLAPTAHSCVGVGANRWSQSEYKDYLYVLTPTHQQLWYDAEGDGFEPDGKYNPKRTLSYTAWPQPPPFDGRGLDTLNIPGDGQLAGSGTVNANANTLTATGSVMPGASLGRLNVEGAEGTLRIEGTLVTELQGPGSGDPENDPVDFLNVAGTLDLSAAGNALALNWIPGADQSSKFGGDYGEQGDWGEYVIAMAMPFGINGEFDTIAVGNIGSAYLNKAASPSGKGIEYDPNEAAVAVFLYDLLDGDANLDGVVDTDDYFAMAGNWYQAGTFDWFDGDFTFDGQVTTDDYFAMAGSWYQTAGSGGGGGMTLPASAMPEPGTLGLLLAAGLAMALAGRRRRRVMRCASGRVMRCASGRQERGTVKVGCSSQYS